MVDNNTALNLLQFKNSVFTSAMKIEDNVTNHRG